MSKLGPVHVVSPTSKSTTGSLMSPRHVPRCACGVHVAATKSKGHCAIRIPRRLLVCLGGLEVGLVAQAWLHETPRFAEMTKIPLGRGGA